MSQTWQDYQQQAADFFRRLGLSAHVEKKVEGVRGSHDIDVYVEGNYKGIEFKWVVECKAWGSNIPKEKVMALYLLCKISVLTEAFYYQKEAFSRVQLDRLKIQMSL
jgi:hypothetical protein